MGQFIDIIFSFPTIVFTISTVILLGFWTVMALFGAGMNALDDLDFDFDMDTDIEVDAGVGETDLDLDAGTGEADAGEMVDSSGGGGLVRSLAHLLGLTSMPLLLALNLESLFAWLTSVVATAVLGHSDGTIALLGGLVILVASVAVGVAVTRAIGAQFAYVFTPTRALRQSELVGAVCEITTQRVTADFGQAEVRDAEGASLIVQVRCAKPNDLSSGDRALIFDLDSETGLFSVSPDRSLAP